MARLDIGVSFVLGCPLFCLIFLCGVVGCEGFQVSCLIAVVWVKRLFVFEFIFFIIILVLELSKVLDRSTHQDSIFLYQKL